MEKKQQVMELWRRCFHDTDEFIRFYFDHKYSDENSLVYEENGKALSALQMLPYPMSWKDTLIQTSYISGACTLQEARNRGIMTMLLKTAFQEMYKHNIFLTTLIPAEDWLFDYYANQGYTTVFEYTLQSYQPDTAAVISGLEINAPESYNEQFVRNLSGYFGQNMRKRPCCIQHPLDDFLTIVQDIYMSGGRLITVNSSHSNQPSGLALAIPQEKEILVCEIFYDSANEKEALFQGIGQIWKNLEIKYKIQPFSTETQRLGMARIINAGQMLQHYASLTPDISLTLKLNDPQLPDNSGIYILSEGQCTKTGKTENSVDIETDIPVLTKALLGFHTEQLPTVLMPLFRNCQPYMSLMLD